MGRWGDEPWAVGAPAATVRQPRQRTPVKPGMPLLLPCALAAWAAAAALYTAGRTLDGPVLCAVAAGGALAALVAVAVLLRGRPQMAAAVAAGCAVGLAVGAVGALALQADARWAAAEPRDYDFELLEDASSSGFGLSAKARAVDGQGCAVVVRASFEGPGAALCGTRFAARCALAPPSEAAAAYYWAQGMAASAVLGEVEPAPAQGPAAAVRALRARAVGLLADHGGAQGPLLQALVCGYRQPLRDSGAYEGYKAVGLAHVVAVSGAHLAIVAMVLGWALRRLRVPHGLGLAVLAAFLGAYLVFAGVPLSAVRAAAMVALSLAAQSVRRRGAALNALALCLLGFIAVDPSAAVSVSLFLSAGSTLGIVLFASLMASWLNPRSGPAGRPRRLARLVAEPLGLTLAANAATLLPSAALFSQLPLIAPLSNIVATPLFSLGCVAGLAAAAISCAVPAAAPLLIGAASAAAWPLSAACAALASVPYASVPAALPAAPMVALSAAGCAALWLAWPRLRMRTVVALSAAVAAAMAFAIAVAPAFQGDRITMLDVGQGDAFLVRSGAAAVLIDTGNQDALLREALGREGVYRLDAVVVTHPDDDHCASLRALGNVVEVGAVYTAADGLECPCERCEGLRADAASVAAQGLQGLEAGDRLQAGRFSLEVIWPRAFADEGGNADSLCLRAALDADQDGTADWTALFCGDAEAEQLQELIDDGALGAVDVLKVGHHGSRAGLTDGVAQALSPRIALVSVGARNRYGHPAPETLSRLETVGATVFRTDQHGTVDVRLSTGSVAVGTQRP